MVRTKSGLLGFEESGNLENKSRKLAIRKSVFSQNLILIPGVAETIFGVEKKNLEKITGLARPDRPGPGYRVTGPAGPDGIIDPPKAQGLHA